MRRSHLHLWALMIVGLAPQARAAEPGTRVRLEIDKSERLLWHYDGAELVARYRIGLGFSPLAAKGRQGDGATPEGEYRICVKNPHSRFFLSVGLDYPNLRDARRGLAEGTIGNGDFHRIERALGRGTCPPWDTALGGEIFIHGRGSGSDWTLGCVALDDPAMKALYAAVRLGTRVTIRP